MQESKALAPVIMSTVANVNIDKNDIIAIQVAKAERMLNDELRTAQTDMKAHEKIIKTLAAVLDKSYEQTTAENTKNALSLFKSIGSEFSGLKMPTASYQVEKESLSICLVLKSSDYGSVTLTKSVPFSAEQKETQAKIKTAKDALAESQAIVVTVKQKLAKLPSLERQYRAALAEKALQSTEAGQAMLNAISGDVKADVLALPSA